MMINKRLINLCKESKKYIALTILVNWISVLCNIVTIILIGQFINKIYVGQRLNINGNNILNSMMEFNVWGRISLLAAIVIIAILLAIRYSCNILYAKFSNAASANARVTLRELIYKKLLKLGTGYTSVESTSAVVQVSVEGIEQLEIYFGKYLVEVVICTINLVLISSAYVLAAYMMLEDSGIIYLKDFLQAIIACFPLLLVSVTAANCFYFMFDNESMAVTIWSIVIVFIPLLISMAGRKINILGKIANWLPWNMVGNARFDSSSKRMIMLWNSQEGFIRCFIVGIIGILIFYILGLVMFNKKEIK